MRRLAARVSFGEGWRRPLAISAGAAVLYSLVVFGYGLLPSSNVSISGTLWHSLALSTGFALVTVGVPVFLRLRYELRSPGVLLVAILLFWHVLVYVPPFGSGQGDSPGFLFVFVFAPIYLVAYAVLGGVERWLRSRPRSRFDSAS